MRPYSSTGPHITFKGANIHIVSGSGFTSDNDNPTGPGNLIIGYDEPPGGLSGTDRRGSHNLVIGRYNRFTQTAFGGLVAGELNTISNREAIDEPTAFLFKARLAAGISHTAQAPGSGGQTQGDSQVPASGHIRSSIFNEDLSTEVYFRMCQDRTGEVYGSEELCARCVGRHPKG